MVKERTREEGDIQNGREWGSNWLRVDNERTPMVNEKYEGNPWGATACISGSGYRWENMECNEKDMCCEKKDKLAEKCDDQEVIWWNSSRISLCWNAKFVRTFKDMVLEACDEVHGKKKGRKGEEHSWW